MKILKKYNCFLEIFFVAMHAFIQLIVELECKASREHAQGIMHDGEAIIGTYFAVFKESYLFFNTTTLKVELLKLKSNSKKLNLCILLAVLQGLKVVYCRISKISLQPSGMSMKHHSIAI